MILLQGLVGISVALINIYSCTVVFFCVCIEVGPFRINLLGFGLLHLSKTDCNDITEILLKMALNTINPNPSRTSGDIMI
jgi:hypothetical protein